MDQGLSQRRINEAVNIATQRVGITRDERRLDVVYRVDVAYGHEVVPERGVVMGATSGTGAWMQVTFARQSRRFQLRAASGVRGSR